MHLQFMNETMYFNSKGFQGSILRTFRRNYGKLREKERTNSLTEPIGRSEIHQGPGASFKF